MTTLVKRRVLWCDEIRPCSTRTGVGKGVIAMSDTMKASPAAAESTKFVGQIGVFGVIGLALVLLIHPFGSSSLYDDGLEFLDHVNWFWMMIHVVGAVLFLTWPPVIDAWANGLQDARARVVGRWAHMTSIAGVAVGTLHLVGFDTMTFWAYRDTYEAAGGSEAAATGADVLLRLHAASLSSWVVVFFLTVPLLGGVATMLDGRFPKWLGWVGIVGGLIQVPALAITLAERQWTTLSEQFLFRTGVTLFIVWMLAIAWSLQREAPIGSVAANA